VSRTFDDKLQWDLKNHRHGLLEAIIAANPKSLDAIVDAIELEADIMRRQAIEHYEKPEAQISIFAQRLAVRRQ
jgi:hypothetical protein